MDQLLEWVDHSNATALEDFFADLEKLFIQWGLTDMDSMSNNTIKHSDDIDFQEGDVKLGRDSYRALLVLQSTQFDVIEGSENKIEYVEYEMMTNADLSTTPDFTKADFERWFGIRNYVMICPAERNGNSNDASLILSAASVVGPLCHPCIPILIPTVLSRKSKSRHQSQPQTVRDAHGIKIRMNQSTYYKDSSSNFDFFGVCVTSNTTIHYDVTTVPLQEVAESLYFLTGLTELFRSRLLAFSKLVEKPIPQLESFNLDLAAGHILIDVQHWYSIVPVKKLSKSALRNTEAREVRWSDWLDEDPSWRLHLDFDEWIDDDMLMLRGGSNRPPLWGPIGDPIEAITLRVLWPSFKESSLAENASFSSFVAESAPQWIIEAKLRERETTGDDEDSETQEEDQDREQSVLCPLATSLRYILQQWEMAKSDEYKNSLLCHVGLARNDTRGGGGELPSDRKLAISIVRELLQCNEDRLEAKFLREQLKNLQEIYAGGGLSLAEFREARERLWIDGVHDFPSKRYTRTTHERSTCWICRGQLAEHAAHKRDKKTHSSPSNILAIFALRMVPKCGGSILTFASVWRALVAELRYRWENMVEIPVDRCTEPPETIGKTSWLLLQKLRLLSMCVAMRIHARDTRNADTESTDSSQSGRNNDDGDKYDDEEEDDEFFDAEENLSRSSTPTPGSSPSHKRGRWRDPWTVSNTLWTSDMKEERETLLRSVAASRETADIHERLLKESIFSDMQAFKFTNPLASFEDFSKWRKLLDGTRWQSMWDQCTAKSLADQIMENPALFNPDQEAEKILHFLETMSPLAAITPILEAGMMSAKYVLDHALAKFDKFDRVQAFLRSASKEVSVVSVVKPDSTDGDIIVASQIQSSIDATERVEYMLSIAASLLHKFPQDIAQVLLTEELATSQLLCNLESKMVQERQHIRALLFPSTHDDSLSLPYPSHKEYLFRCLTKHVQNHDDTSAMIGVNRMYVSLTAKEMTMATALSETIM